MYRSTDKQQAKMNMKEFWDKKLGRSTLKIAMGTSADGKEAKKLLTHGVSGKVAKNKTGNSTPSKGGAKLTTKMENCSRGIPSASEKSMTFNPATQDPGAVSRHTRKISGKGRGNATTKTNHTDKNDWGWSQGLAVANTKFMGSRV